MTDPHEIIEAAGYRLLSADGVTDEMVDAADRANPMNDSESVTEAEIRAAILAAPLFGKGSEKP